MSDEQAPKPPPPPWERGRDEPPPRFGAEEPPPPPYQPPNAMGFSNYDDALQRVKAPAITIICIGALTILLQVIGLVLRLVSSGDMANQTIPPDTLQPLEEAFGPEGAQALTNALDFFLSPTYFYLSLMVGLTVTAFVIYGAIKMMKLESWGLTVAATIVGMAPCISPCCWLLFPAGIWALIVLFDQDVKEAFYS